MGPFLARINKQPCGGRGSLRDRRVWAHAARAPGEPQQTLWSPEGGSAASLLLCPSPIQARARRKDGNPHTPLEDTSGRSRRFRPPGLGANGRWGARATHSRGYSTRAWRAPPAGRGSPTEAREAQPSSPRCPIAGWRLAAAPLAALLTRAPPRGRRTRHRGRSRLDRELGKALGGQEHHRQGSLFQAKEAHSRPKNQPNLTATAFLNCISLIPTTFHLVVDLKPTLVVVLCGNG